MSFKKFLKLTILKCQRVVKIKFVHSLFVAQNQQLTDDKIYTFSITQLSIAMHSKLNTECLVNQQCHVTIPYPLYN